MGRGKSSKVGRNLSRDKRQITREDRLNQSGGVSISRNYT